MPFKVGNTYGKTSKRGQNKVNTQLKQDIQVIVNELLSSIKIYELSRYEKLQYTKMLLPYIAPKMKEYDIKNDLINVPSIESNEIEK